MDTELKHYERVVLHYDAYHMIRFGIPYKRHLEKQRQAFVDKLNEKEQ